MTDGVFNAEPPAGDQPVTPDNAALESRLQAKDAYISQLERETAEMRAELARKEAAERILEEARKAAINPPPSVEAKPAATEPAKPIDEADLVERVLKAQSERQLEATRAANARTVADKLVEIHGTEDAANKYVRARAQELGVGVEFLLDTAKQSPNAFYELVKIDLAPTQQPAPRGDVNAAALKTNAPGVKEGTNAWYEKLRDEIGPTAFYTPKIQQQRMRDAQRLGDAFFQ